MNRLRFFLLGFLLCALLVGLPLALVWAKPAPTPAMRTIAPHSYTPAFTLHSTADIPAKRQLIMDRLWGGTLPDTLPVQEGNQLIVTLPYGLTSTIELYPAPGDTLVIFHGGHEGITDADLTAIEAIHAAGYPVAHVNMPLVGPNAQTVLVGELPISLHNHFALLPASPAPLGVYLEPVIALLNGSNYRRVVMTGISGGGWTSVLAAAIDPRITASFPVAGSTPLGLTLYNQPGDYEHYLPGLYPDVTYEDLYLMAAYQRVQVQTINEYDPCCNNYAEYPIYERAIQQRLNGQGQFRVAVDRGEAQHRVSPAAVQRLLDYLAADNIEDRAARR